MQGRTALGFDLGGRARIIDKFRPDLAFFETTAQLNNSPNSAPGDFKPSWEWHSGLPTLNPISRREYLQVLSRINFYMNQQHSIHIRPY